MAYSSFRIFSARSGHIVRICYVLLRLWVLSSQKWQKIWCFFFCIGVRDIVGGRGAPPPQTGEDGWNTVTRPPKNVLVDPQRLKLTKREQVDDNIQLGPGGRGMTTWQLGSRGGGKVGAGAGAASDSEKQQINRWWSAVQCNLSFDLILISISKSFLAFFTVVSVFITVYSNYFSFTFE